MSDVQATQVRSLAQPKPYVGVPSYKGVEPLFLASMVDLATRMGHNMRLDLSVGDSAVGRARNEITRRFLASDCTHLLFIDSDLVFTPDHVTRILAHGVDLVGGMYPKKQQGPIQFVCNRLPEKPPVEPGGIFELRYIGTGFMCISRRVFDVMLERLGPSLAYVSDQSGEPEHDFFAMGVYQYPDGHRRWLSEDWMFCQRWLDCGGKVYGDGEIVLSHVGTAVYPLDYQQQQLFGKASLPDQRVGGGGVPPPSPANSLSATDNMKG